jgi:hypothetical protein
MKERTMNKSLRRKTAGTGSGVARLVAAPWFPFTAGVVVTMAIIAAFVAFARPGSEPEAPPAPAVPTAVAAPLEDHDHGAELSIRRMTPAELRTAIERGEAVAIDVRDADAYAAGHIAGAYHIPLAVLESQVSFLPRGKLLVTYCT